MGIGPVRLGKPQSLWSRTKIQLSAGERQEFNHQRENKMPSVPSRHHSNYKEKTFYAVYCHIYSNLVRMMLCDHWKRLCSFIHKAYIQVQKLEICASIRSHIKLYFTPAGCCAGIVLTVFTRLQSQLSNSRIVLNPSHHVGVSHMVTFNGKVVAFSCH